MSELDHDTADDERLADLRGAIMAALDRATAKGAYESDLLAVLAHAAGEVTAAAGRREITHLVVMLADLFRTNHLRARRRLDDDAKRLGEIAATVPDWAAQAERRRRLARRRR